MRYLPTYQLSPHDILILPTNKKNISRKAPRERERERAERERERERK